MDFEVIAAFCFMPLLMLVAAQGWAWMICAFTCLPLVLVLYYYKMLASKTRTRFFLAWSIVSFFFLLAVFELEVVPYLEILFSENFVLMCFVATMCIFVYLVKTNSQPASLSAQATERATNKADQTKKVKCEICSCIQPARTNHCDLCGYCIHKRDHHSVWLDICIGSRNQRYFIIALIALAIACFYSSNLTLTTICHPTLVGGLILLPDDCSDVFGDIHIAVCFVSAIYTLMIAGFSLYLLLQQLWFVCHNSTFEEWKQGQLGLYSNGNCRNIIDFCYGYS
ncbi:palmitoyltransferase ZDHHC23-like [Stegodyphus dumicola]|uniref:palmitoyltransferase ZDHHC23-like n=1 Tax=Stegodyphus dumicola TaxID=202533 RepID=UPI0015A9BA59|nr:palmitoyltransferase ZDHHC23-like [Stegodyphus dumicola]